MNFQEILGIEHRPYSLPLRMARGDKGSQDDDARFKKKFADFRYPPEIFGTIRFRKTKILRQTMSNVVTVQKDRPTAFVMQVLLNCSRQGRLARA